MYKDFTMIKASTPLLEAVEIVKEREVVLIRKRDKSICGLVTTTDLAEEFYGLSITTRLNSGGNYLAPEYPLVTTSLEGDEILF
jgi:hypothetical protein